MATANYSVPSLYGYDSTIFDGLTVPATIDKDKVVSKILMESSPFETLYSDPDELKLYITVWSDASQDRWGRWANAWTKADEFNPLENKDITIKDELTKTGQDKTVDEVAYGKTDTRSPTLTNTETISAYDSVSYNPHNKSEMGGKDETKLSGKDTRTVTGSFVDRKDTRDVHEHGNIGVTSLAELMTSYDKAVDQLDTYEKITADFIRQFCILVY